MNSRSKKPAPPSSKPMDSRALPPPEPTPEEEEAAFIRSLERHGQLYRGKGPLPPGATHVIETTPTGAKRLRRKRFSAT